MDGSSSCWIVCLRPVAAPRMRLFCFPHGGGSAAIFKNWSTKLAQDIEVWAVELPGRGRRLLEPAAVRIDDIIAKLAEESRPYLGTPFAIFGHSLGALIAFEFARQLRSMDMAPVHLFMSGRHAPHVLDPEPAISHLPNGEFVEAVRQRYQGVPEEILNDAEMMELWLPALRADISMSEAYHYEARSLLAFPITCFGGWEDHSASTAELSAWREQTSAAFKLRMFPGGHFFIDSAREALLESVGEDLEHSLRGIASRYSP